MDPRLLQTFSAVVTQGSFSKAAGQLGYTQSAVSQQIASLEAELGVELIRRRPVGPTEAGARLLDHVAPILLRINTARAEIQRLTSGPTGRLSVGVCPLAATARTLRITGEVARRAGVHEFTVRTLPRQAVAEGVATGTLDLGLVDGFALPDDPLRPFRTDRLRTVPVCREPVVVALPPTHPLAHRTGLRLPDLVDARWIDAPDVSAPLADLRAVLGDGPELRVALRYDGLDVRTYAELLAGGQGLGLLPRSVLTGRQDLTGVPLTAPELTHRVEALRLADGPPVVDDLVASLR
ncbi:LysR family transcriptional regulator [Streptomyces sp. BBFR2]|uniref:LysR family transcriptional regulator n=1 Tax=Streptomyces sp. BBFR2 TaxID=3372854 RepID=UPI0037DA15E3